MRQAMRNLLDLRRAQMPSSSLTRADCSSPARANISTLPKQECVYSYCQTLVLTDHDTGELCDHDHDDVDHQKNVDTI